MERSQLILYFFFVTAPFIHSWKLLIELEYFFFQNEIIILIINDHELN